MSLFAWTCTMCGRQAETKDRQAPHCPVCGFVMRRQWAAFSVQRVSSIQPHFNHSLGSYVNNRSELRSEFSRQSDEMSERMGFHVEYEPVDPVDLKNSPESFGVTSEGLDDRAKTLRDSGQTQQERTFK